MHIIHLNICHTLIEVLTFSPEQPTVVESCFSLLGNLGLGGDLDSESHYWKTNKQLRTKRMKLLQLCLSSARNSVKSYMQSQYTVIHSTTNTTPPPPTHPPSQSTIHMNSDTYTTNWSMSPPHTKLWRRAWCLLNDWYNDHPALVC